MDMTILLPRSAFGFGLADLTWRSRRHREGGATTRTEGVDTMSRKTDRTKALEQIFANRLPHLDAATDAAAALTEASEAVHQAEARRRETAEHLRIAYDDAVAAGWTEVDLRLVGVERPRRPSPGRPRSSPSDANAPASTG